MKNKTNKNKRVKISQKNILDIAVKDLWSIGALAVQLNDANNTAIPSIIEKIVELQDRINRMKMERAAQIGARAAKLS